MKISQLKILILQLLLIDPTHLQNITIHRVIERNKWNKVKDSFDIPKSACQQGERAFGDYCHHSDIDCKLDETSHSYSCSCPKTNATLTLRDNLWRCQENTEVRKQLGCGINYSLFDREEDDDELRTLKANIWPWRATKLNRRSCVLNFDLSWYIGCNAKREPLIEYASSFELRWFSVRYFIGVLNNKLQGVVVNLGFNCTTGSYTNGCFQFKVEGTLTCPIVQPQLDGFPSMTIPTTSSFSKKTKTAPKGTSSTASTKPSQSPSQDRSRPSSRIEQRSDGQKSSPVGVIAGVTASVATVLLFITGVCFYRRRKSRKETDANEPPAHQVKSNNLGKSSHRNGGFNPDVKNVYVDSGNNEEKGDLYASLSVPEGNNIYGHGHIHDPVYNVLEDPSSDNDKEGEYYGALSINQPVYNVSEDLSVQKQGGVENEGYGEVGPVYNVLEVPYYDGAGRPEHYNSAPVNEPFYNTLEESHANGEGTPGAKDEPVYNTLEESCPVDVGEDSGYASAAARGPWH